MSRATHPPALATRSAIRAASRVGAWPRRSASSSTAWTVGAAFMRAATAHRLGEGEVAERGDAHGMIRATQRHEIHDVDTMSAGASLSE